MTTLREAAQQALEALEDVDGPITALLGSLLGSPDADAPGAKVRASIAALRAALTQQAQTCAWRDNLDAIYETECGNLHIINDGTPEDNGMKYCCYCGKALEAGA